MASSQHKLHIYLPNPPEKIEFTTPQRKISGKKEEVKNPQLHGAYLKNCFEAALKTAKAEITATKVDRQGLYLEFTSSPGLELALTSLENMPKKIRLCNVKYNAYFSDKENPSETSNEESSEKKDEQVTSATVYVPFEKADHFLNKINAYLGVSDSNGDTEEDDEDGDSEKTPPKSAPNTKLLNSIESLRSADNVDSFWTDDIDLIPDKEQVWCEVWLRSEQPEIIEQFNSFAGKNSIQCNSRSIIFPERTVKLIKANREQLAFITKNSDNIAEYRRAKDMAALLSMSPRGQVEWATDLLERLKLDNESNVSICVLDTGVNNGHPLLKPILNSQDCQTVNPDWGSHDHHNHGHGTAMAGLAGYGNLQEALQSTAPVNIGHVLESVKILPPSEANDPELWGEITTQGILLAEIEAPERKRISCLAVTATGSRDRGRPSSWSGALDQFTAGVMDETQRLILVSAGNISDLGLIHHYPDTQTTDAIHDPAQAWNALCIGAYTSLTQIVNPAYSHFTPIADKNQISPFTTSSLEWEDKWPIKPEVVFEGGNCAKDPRDLFECIPELSLLSTHHKPMDRLFDYFNMTSAATALASNFAAQLQCAYPEYWPETIRGLIVHSAEWPEEMKKQFVNDEAKKQQISSLLKICGYGVPDLSRALYCASNALTLIAENEIQPYKLDGSTAKTNQMHLYNLPWPKEELLNLGDVDVEMRITLSYFIEPGPGEIGWKDRYRYPSHLLRFQLISPREDMSDFLERVNGEYREKSDDQTSPTNRDSTSTYWTIGQNRDKGSLHSDIWTGTAAELAESNIIAITPVIGWWRERKQLGKVENKARYSLIVSIKTPEERSDIDIYTPVAQSIKSIIPIEVQS